MPFFSLVIEADRARFRLLRDRETSSDTDPPRQTAIARTGRFTTIPREELRDVASPDDVAQVVARMLVDLQVHPREWENHTLERFLDALARCIKAQPQLYANLGEQYPGTRTWKLFAEALVAATGYEQAKPRRNLAMKGIRWV